MAVKKVKKGKKVSKIKKCSSKSDMKIKLEKLHEKIMGTSWHHLQTESTMKQFFGELIEVLKNGL